jgi:hypothetical protein
VTAVRTPPQRHWRSYGTDPLPSPAEALQQPLAAFPSWFLRITCDGCGKDRMVNEAHAPWRDRSLFDNRPRNEVQRYTSVRCGNDGYPYPTLRKQDDDCCLLIP